MKRILILALFGLIVLGCSHGRIKLVKVGSYKKERASFVSSERENIAQDQIDLANKIVYEHESTAEIDSLDIIAVQPNTTKQIPSGIKQPTEVISKHIEPNILRSKDHSHVVRTNGKSELSSGVIYLAGLSMLFLSFLGIRSLNKRRLQIASWAVKNKRTSMGISVATNFALAYTGYGIGSHLDKMDISISDSVFHVGATLAGIMLVGMVAKNKLSRRGPFSILSNGNQLGMMISAISLILVTASVGNNKKHNSYEAPLVASFVDEFNIDEGDEPCDELVLKDGRVLSVEVLSETENSIRYKDCNVSTLTVKSILLSEIQEIRYNSGQTKTDHKDNVDPDPDGISSGGILALYIVFAILLTILFAALACAAVCAWGSTGLVVVIGLLLLLVLYNWGMSNAYVNRKRIEGKIK